MDERLQFVARRLAGEQMADLCREFGISRKTGYKIFDRYKECGVQGLNTRRLAIGHEGPVGVPEFYYLHKERSRAEVERWRDRARRQFRSRYGSNLATTPSGHERSTYAEPCMARAHA